MRFSPLSLLSKVLLLQNPGSRINIFEKRWKSKGQ